MLSVADSEPHFWFEEVTELAAEPSRFGFIKQALERGYPLIEHGERVWIPFVFATAQRMSTCLSAYLPHRPSGCV
jgi:hypothetical protein